MHMSVGQVKRSKMLYIFMDSLLALKSPCEILKFGHATLDA